MYYKFGSVRTVNVLLLYFFLVIAGYLNHSKSTTSKTTLTTTLNFNLTKVNGKTDDKNIVSGGNRSI